MKQAIVVGILTLLGSALGSPARSQISPGELAAAHAHLEGSGNCLQCHAAGHGVSRALCLECHGLLRERIRTSAGLHARPDYAACETCHIDHQGRDFELLWWGEDGMESFEHRQAGWPLEGHHREVGCRECHRPDHLREPEMLIEAGKDPARTFFGLDRTCESCHADPHLGQFAGTACDSCHGQERFAPAGGFDHDAVFLLEGAHVEAACAECHPPLSPAAPSKPPAPEAPDHRVRADLRFRDLGRTACSDCHRDPHGNRLGSDCASCHVATRWSEVQRAELDHSRTSYPLEGRHRRVACDSCHGRSFERPRPAFGACSDCHADPHLGQFADTPRGAGCDSCHDLGGFLPARYTVADHQSSSFPLEGRHRDQACLDCHRIVSPAELPPPLALAAARRVDDVRRVRRFRFPSTSCPDCHRDPHAGTAVAAGATGDAACTECHDLSGWHSIAFSHRRTEWPLEGRHRGLRCDECHQPDRPAVGLPETGNLTRVEATARRFDGLSTACASCHEDPHAGQFTPPPAPTGAAALLRCERCHADARFRPAVFDHQLDSRFPLEGAHARVSCEKCHPLVERDDRQVVLYRPLARECSACHAVLPEDPVGSSGPAAGGAG